MVRGIAKEGVLTVECFAKVMRLDASTSREVFEELAAAGAQTDERGSIIGASLSTRETRHKIRVAGKHLYAWSALDALYIPGLLDQTGYVESSCIASG